MTEELVIDIQAFVGPQEEYLPKEICVLSVNHPYSDSWVIGPPCRFSELGASIRRQNNWLSRHYHRLSWEDGEVPPFTLPMLLNRATANASVVYVSGKEKSIYLSKIISTPVVNLDAYSPALKRMEAPRSLCLFHGLVTCEMYKCAVQNAHKLKNWIVEEKKKENLDFDYFACNKLSTSDLHKLRTLVDYDSSSDSESEGVDEVDLDGLTPEQVYILEDGSLKESLL